MLETTKLSSKHYSSIKVLNKQVKVLNKWINSVTLFDKDWKWDSRVRFEIEKNGLVCRVWDGRSIRIAIKIRRKNVSTTGTCKLEKVLTFFFRIKY